jgi:hypothetical protein
LLVGREHGRTIPLTDIHNTTQFFLSRHRFRYLRMRASPLRQDEQTPDYESRNDRRCNRTAQRETTVVYGLVEKIANGGSQWPGKNEGSTK